LHHVRRPFRDRNPCPIRLVSSRSLDVPSNLVGWGFVIRGDNSPIRWAD
jgi:hypothetical protein